MNFNLQKHCNRLCFKQIYRCFTIGIFEYGVQAHLHKSERIKAGNKKIKIEQFPISLWVLKDGRVLWGCPALSFIKHFSNLYLFLTQTLNIFYAKMLMDY